MFRLELEVCPVPAPGLPLQHRPLHQGCQPPAQTGQQPPIQSCTFLTAFPSGERKAPKFEPAVLSLPGRPSTTGTVDPRLKSQVAKKVWFSLFEAGTENCFLETLPSVTLVIAFLLYSTFRQFSRQPKQDWIFLKTSFRDLEKVFK